MFICFILLLYWVICFAICYNNFITNNKNITIIEIVIILAFSGILPFIKATKSLVDYMEGK